LQTEELKNRWLESWPKALAFWSRFVQLTEPRWCFTTEEEQKEQLTGSFAMIRLVDHAVVISLRQVRELGLEDFAPEILAHEIGHHVYCPADLHDNARVLARIRAGLPTKEHLAPMIANLYEDLLINDRLQRTASLRLGDVYRKLAKSSPGKLWTLYMRIYEILWNVEKGELAKGEIDQKLNYDAQLGARLIRNYSKDWLDGAGRFAVLCLDYLLEDEANLIKAALNRWQDTKGAGVGGIPGGLAEADEDEAKGAIHPADDPDLSGVEASNSGRDSSEANVPGRARQTGRKTLKKYREPFEYTEILKASGVNLSERQIVARYYRERALPYLIPFPVKQSPQAVDPIPEGSDAWDIGEALENVDWPGTVQVSPQVIPGVTTRQRLSGPSPGTTPEAMPVDLYLGIDCSGSMGDPARMFSYPVLAGVIVAMSALRSGSRVKAVLSGEPGTTIATDGFVRDENAVLELLTNYLGTGNAFGIHRLRETFDDWPASSPRLVHILIISDNDIFNLLGLNISGKLGWEIARQALEKARGGGTYVLQLPAYLRQNKAAQAVLHPGCKRMEAEGFNVYNNVDSMEELLEFARRFSKMNYEQAPLKTGARK